VAQQPLVGQFADDLEAVVKRYCDQGLTIAETLGTLDILRDSILRDAHRGEDEPPDDQE
jgi:hypothetical protein